MCMDMYGKATEMRGWTSGFIIHKTFTSQSKSTILGI